MGGYTYTVLLDPSDEGDGYTVTVPALPGCITQGSTIDEALERAKEAIAVHIEGLRADGEEIPWQKVPPRLEQVTVEMD